MLEGTDELLWLTTFLKRRTYVLKNYDSTWKDSVQRVTYFEKLLAQGERWGCRRGEVRRRWRDCFCLGVCAGAGRRRGRTHQLAHPPTRPPTPLGLQATSTLMAQSILTQKSAQTAPGRFSASTMVSRGGRACAGGAARPALPAAPRHPPTYPTHLPSTPPPTHPSMHRQAHSLCITQTQTTRCRSSFESSYEPARLPPPGLTTRGPGHVLPRHALAPCDPPPLARPRRHLPPPGFPSHPRLPSAPAIQPTIHPRAATCPATQPSPPASHSQHKSQTHLFPPPPSLRATPPSPAPVISSVCASTIPFRLPPPQSPPKCAHPLSNKCAHAPFHLLALSCFFAAGPPFPCLPPPPHSNADSPLAPRPSPRPPVASHTHTHLHSPARTHTCIRRCQARAHAPAPPPPLPPLTNSSRSSPPPPAALPPPPLPRTAAGRVTERGALGCWLQGEGWGDQQRGACVVWYQVHVCACVLCEVPSARVCLWVGGWTAFILTAADGAGATSWRCVCV